MAFVPLPAAQAITVPETLADRRPVGAGPVVPPFPIDYLGVLWEARGTVSEHAQEEAGAHGAVRFRVGGAWTAWQPLTEDGAAADGQGSAPSSRPGTPRPTRSGHPRRCRAPRAVALNTTDGRAVEIGRRPAGDAGRLRAELHVPRGVGRRREPPVHGGRENWPAEFHPAQAMSVHHTAGANDDATPRPTVRAIYRYHAIDRGAATSATTTWSTRRGRVYEGRWSGAASTPCGATGGGQDFAHDAATGSDRRPHRWLELGEHGAALLGTFTRPTARTLPPRWTPWRTCSPSSPERHALNPKAVVNYVNPVNGATKTVNMISGHRDWVATDCPGGRLYDDLPVIRERVAARMAPADAPPTVSINSPANGATSPGR